MKGSIEDQLRDYAEHVTSQSVPVDLDGFLVGEPVPPPVTQSIGAGRLIKPIASTRRRGWPVAAGAAAAVLALVGAATLLSRAPDTASPVENEAAPPAAASTPRSAPQTAQSDVPTSSTPNPLPSWHDDPGCEAGGTWSRVCDDAAGFEGAVMWGVVAGGPGLVAVGGEGVYFWRPEDIASQPESDEDAAAVVWTSPDGVSWSRVSHDESVFGGEGVQQMFSVTTGGPGLVAVGFDGTMGNEEGNAAVWTSPDGLSWSRVPHEEEVFGGPGAQRMLSVTSGGLGLVAVGFETGTDGDPADAAVWNSSDGLNWSRVLHDEAVLGGVGTQKMVSVTEGGPGWVAVGSDGHTDWFDPPSDEPAADAAVWTSPDGIRWSRVPHDDTLFGGSGEQRMLGVTGAGLGLVAVGTVEGDPFEDRTYPTSDAAVWTSQDGITWSRVPHDKEVFAKTEAPGHESGFVDAHEVMRSVTVGGPGFVAVGDAGIEQAGWEAAVWTSPDGITWSRVFGNFDVFNPGYYDGMSSVTATSSGVVAVGGGNLGDLVAATVWHDW